MDYTGSATIRTGHQTEQGLGLVGRDRELFVGAKRNAFKEGIDLSSIAYVVADTMENARDAA